MAHYRVFIYLIFTMMFAGAADRPQPAPIACQISFISQVNPGLPNGDSWFLERLTTASDEDTACRLIREYAPQSAILETTARYTIAPIPPELQYFCTLVQHNAETPADGFWLSPAMVAALTGRMRTLNCILVHRKGPTTLAHELMLANELALLGSGYFLERYMALHPDLIQTGAGGLCDMFGQEGDTFRPMSLVRYWLGGGPSEHQQLTTHPLISNITVSERALKRIAQALSYLNDRFGQHMTVRAPLIEHELRQRLQQHRLTPTLEHVASVVLAADFKQRLRDISGQMAQTSRLLTPSSHSNPADPVDR